MNLTRNELLDLSDEALLKVCKCEAFRSTGPGGQHRNTSNTAVRLVLSQEEINATASESRSQHVNKKKALKRLRKKVALVLRIEPLVRWKGSWSIGKNDKRYLFLMGSIIDSLEAHNYFVAETAKYQGISTGKFVRVLSKDPTLYKFVNEKRLEKGLKPLKF